MNIIEEIFEIRSSIEILADDIKIYTSVFFVSCFNFSFSYSLVD